MKKLIFFPLVLASLSGCGGDHDTTPEQTAENPDLNDPEAFASIVAVASDPYDLELRTVEGKEMLYVKDKNSTYTGWTKVMMNSEQPMVLIQHKDGKEHGQYLAWHDNGQKERASLHKEGKAHGLYTLWHRSGKKSSEGHYKEGKKDGDWNTYYEAGGPKFRKTFQDGNLTAAISWQPNGEKCPVTNFADGEGAWVTYHPNGQKSEEGAYAHGKREGLWYRWHENGQKGAEGNYRNGKQHGVWLEYNKEGEPYNPKTFKDGQHLSD